MGERDRRIGHNEALFREVNERIERLTQEFQGTNESMQILCECGDDSCSERLEIPAVEYEEVRSDPTHFAIAHGHDAPDVESVIDDRGGYVIVKKHPGEPAAIADELDSRA
jgi:hypothetical protein